MMFMGKSIDEQLADLSAVPLAFFARVPADPVGQVLSWDQTHQIADSPKAPLRTYALSKPLECYSGFGL